MLYEVITPGRDPECLVVIAVRSAAGKSIIEPESVFAADSVGRIGKVGRSLVGGNHQVGVFLVVGDNSSYNFV